MNLHNLKNLNNQAITFSAIALLFLGSLYYFVSVAFDNRDALAERNNVDQYLEDLNF